MSQDAFNELDFVRPSAFDTNGERKTMSIGESDDFRPFATFGGPDHKAPFFAPVKGGIDESLLQLLEPGLGTLQRRLHATTDKDASMTQDKGKVDFLEDRDDFNFCPNSIRVFDPAGPLDLFGKGGFDHGQTEEIIHAINAS